MQPLDQPTYSSASTRSMLQQCVSMHVPLILEKSCCVYVQSVAACAICASMAVNTQLLIGV